MHDWDFGTDRIVQVEPTRLSVRGDEEYHGAFRFSTAPPLVKVVLVILGLALLAAVFAPIVRWLG